MKRLLLISLLTLTISNVNAAEVNVGILPAQNMTGARVHYGTDITNLNHSEDMGMQTSDYTVKNLDCNTEYHFNVSAYNEQGSSERSNTVTITMPPCPEVVIVPENWVLEGLIITPK